MLCPRMGDFWTKCREDLAREGHHCCTSVRGKDWLSLASSALDDPANIALLQMEDEEDARLLREEQELISSSNKLKHDENTD